MAASALEYPPVEVRFKDLAQLRPEAHDSVRTRRLESAPSVRPEDNRLTVEAHIVELKPQDFGLSASSE